MSQSTQSDHEQTQDDKQPSETEQNQETDQPNDSTLDLSADAADPEDVHFHEVSLIHRPNRNLPRLAPILKMQPPPTISSKTIPKKSVQFGENQMIIVPTAEPERSVPDWEQCPSPFCRKGSNNCFIGWVRRAKLEKAARDASLHSFFSAKPAAKGGGQG